MNSYYILLFIPVIYIAGWFIWYFRFGGIPQNTPKIISFHKISNRFELGGTFNTVKQFECFMKFIVNNGFTTCSINELLSEYDSKKICIFFDDAYEDIYYYAFPIMKELGLKGVLCPVVEYIGKDNIWDRSNIRQYKHMNKNMINEMIENGFEIICHSIMHKDLRKLNNNELYREIYTSKKQLEDMFNIDIEYFLYPYGLYNNRVKSFVKKAGYKAAFASYNKDNRKLDKYAIGRNTMYIIDTNIDLSIILNRKNLFLYGHEEAKGRIINWFARFSAYIRL